MGKIAFIFAGQGAQSPGMGKSLYDNFSSSRKIFGAADNCLKRNLSELCFRGSKEELGFTENTQPCVFTVDMAAYAALSESSIRPYMAAGFSLGEYAALTAANVLNFDEMLPLVEKRAKYMQDAVLPGRGDMAAILKLDTAIIEEVCKGLSGEGVVEPVNYNCPGQTVIAGEKTAVEKAGKLLIQAGGRVIPIPVSGPFHTSMMKPAAKKLEELFSDIDFRTPEFIVYSNVTAQPVMGGGEEVKILLLKQVMAKVRWHEIIVNMVNAGAEAFVEIGPGKTLSGFVKRICPEVPVYNVEDTASLESAAVGLKEKGFLK